MKINWIIECKAAEAISNKDELFNSLGRIEEIGFANIVTFDNYDFSIIWAVSKEYKVRHYSCALSDYPVPDEWEKQRFREFIDYEYQNGRTTLVWFGDYTTRDLLVPCLNGAMPTEAQRPALLTHCKACLQKGCDTELLCHTSSIEDSKSIFSTGKLLSAVKARKTPSVALARESRNAAGDPPDYFEYVMLSFGNCIAGDRLIMERKLGRNPCDSDLSTGFTPGIRYYFRYEEMKGHPAYTADGYHACKVRDSIDLSRYMAACVVPMSENNVVDEFILDVLKDRVIYLDSSGLDIFDWTNLAYNAARSIV